jgi:hypothetical protein
MLGEDVGALTTGGTSAEQLGWMRVKTWYVCFSVGLHTVSFNPSDLTLPLIYLFPRSSPSTNSLYSSLLTTPFVIADAPVHWLSLIEARSMFPTPCVSS